MILGGYTLPDPFSWDCEVDHRGGIQQMASGALVEDLVATGAKRIWTVGWHNLTAAQRSTLTSAFATIIGASATFVDLDNASYTVTRDASQRTLKFSASRLTSGLVYATSMVLREV